MLLACGGALALLQLLRRAPGGTAPSFTAHADDGDDDGGGVCVAWRATVCGSQYSSRKPLEDLPCSALIRPSEKRLSGALRHAGR